MITMATVLLGAGTRGGAPGPGFWRVVARWVYTGLIGLGTVVGGAWVGDPFGYPLYGCPWTELPSEPNDPVGP